MERLAFSLAETSAALGVSKTTVRRMLTAGDLSGVRVGRRKFVSAKSVWRLVGEPAGEQQTHSGNQ